jgi:CHAT domain-containing protein
MNKFFQYCMLGVFMYAALSCTTPSILATQSIQKGDELNNQNRYGEAIPHYEQYLKLSPQLGVYRNPTMEAEVNRKLANAYSTQGKFKTALACITKSTRIDSATVGNELGLIEDYRQSGLIHAFTGNFSLAMKNLEKSLSLNKGMEGSAKTAKQSSVAETHLALAQVNLTLGNYTETRTFAQFALSIFSKLPEGVAGQIETNLILGIVSRDKGDLTEAVKKIELSSRLAQQNQFNNTRQLQALAEVYYLKGEWETAIRLRLQAAEQAEKTNIKPAIINTYMQLGDAYQKMGDKEKSSAYYSRALKIHQETVQGDTLIVGAANSNNNQFQHTYEYQIKSGSNLGAALANLRLGEMQLAANLPDSAQELFNRSKSLFQKIGNSEGLAKANLELAKVFVLRKEFIQATTLLSQAGSQTIQPDLKWQILFYQGQVKEQQNLLSEARAHYESAILVIDKMRANLTVGEFKTLFANTKVDVYNQLILLLLKNKKQWNDLTYAQAIERSLSLSEQARSRTFLDMLGNKKIEAKEKSDTTLLNREQLLRLKISQLVQETNKAASQSEIKQQLAKELDQVQRDHFDLMQRIRLNSPAYSTLMVVDPPPVQHIQQKLDEKTLLLEYWLSDDALVIWTITRDHVDATTVVLEREALLRLIKASRSAIAFQLPEAENHLSELYKHLVLPVESTLARYSKTIVVPHSSLHFVPFHALRNQKGEFLIEKTIISYAPSSSILLHCLNQTPKKGNKFLGLALGDLSIGSFSGLPGTEVEINQISKLYDDFDAKSKESFRESEFKAQSANYNYVHVATHGVFNKNQPIHSYLLMTKDEQDDGQLTVDEIFGLQMNSKMVTLSACETALGDLGEADELIGLSRAFIYAGSPSVMVSLWKVDDATTSWLMTRFHQYWKAGHTSAEALTFAQRDLINRNFKSSQSRGLPEVEWNPEIQKSVQSKSAVTARNPYFWAPFVLIGNGSL